MTRDDVLMDRIDLLCETFEIDNDLARLEQWHGPTLELEDTRRRVQVVRGVALEQMRALLLAMAPAATTIH